MTDRWIRRGTALLLALLLAFPAGAWAEAEYVESAPVEDAVAEADELLLPGMGIAELPTLSPEADAEAEPEAPGAEPEEGVEYYAEFSCGAEEDDLDSEALFEAYARQVLGISAPAVARLRKVGNDLTGRNLLLYNYLAARVQLVAAGELKSTRFTYSADTIEFENGRWTRQELGLDGSTLDQTAFEAATGLDTRRVVNVLLEDFPYDLYWYRKTKPYGYKFGVTYSIKNDKVSVSQMSFSMAVNEEYAASDYEVSSARISAVRQAAANARAIVAKHAGKSDVAIMDAYWREICDLVEYNNAAYTRSVQDSSYYGNPWQLIWVFDGVSTTNVVCEGYAKAFKYLCDLTDFSGDVFCYTVTGIQGGPHMWNVVQMPDGKNYVVDVTRCDSNPTDPMFLKPPVSGSVAQGYTFKNGSRTLTYTYDDETRSVFSGAQLLLSTAAYNASNAKDAVQGVSISPSGTLNVMLGQVLQLSAATTPAGADTTLTWKSSKPSVATVSADGLVTPVQAGTTVITVRTYNDHTATVTVNVVKPAKPTKVTLNYSGTVAVNLGKTLQLIATLSPSNAASELTWKSSSTKVAKVNANGLVTPVAAGTATITVKTANGKSASVKVQVVNPYAATAVALSAATKTLLVGDTLQLGAAVYPETAVYTLSWKSSNAKVAKVSAKGKVTALKAGTAKITVTTNNKRTATITLKVKNNKADGISAKPSAATIKQYKGAWGLKLKSVEIKTDGKAVCEFYLINGLSGKSKRLENLDVSVLYDDVVIATGVFSKVSVSCAKNAAKVFKVTFSASQVANRLAVGKIPAASYDAFRVYVDSGTLRTS